MNTRLEKARIPPHLLKYFETDFCSSCYVCHTVEILREIRRVLRKDGVVFLNLGDSYASGGHWDSKDYNKGIGGKSMHQGRALISGNLKPKDLCLIPFRVAIAAQTDGWWVRSIIIWSKPNPMPESVTDRPTESHEYILMLTKSARYYWDADAVREPQQMSSLLRATRGWEGDTKRDYPEGPQSHIDKYFNKSYEEAMALPGRNIRSVWEFPTQPFPESHFAVFPEALPKKCIMAATPEAGCCSKCGAPWERLTEDNREYQAKNVGGKSQLGGLEQGKRFKDRYNANPITLGWQPTCDCNADTKPSTVLDPFAGRGTVGVVAKELNRNAILIDISEEYCALAKKCIEAVPLPMKL